MVLDSVTGDLSDTRTRYLGSRPVKLFRIKMQGSEAVSEMDRINVWDFGAYCLKLKNVSLCKGMIYDSNLFVFLTFFLMKKEH